jgi:hypothetical protein
MSNIHTILHMSPPTLSNSITVLPFMLRTQIFLIRDDDDDDDDTDDDYITGSCILNY